MDFYRKRISNFILLTTLYSLLTTIFSCQPKAQYDTLQEPMKNFTLNLNDSLRGAASIQDLSCYLFTALKGQITFEQLKKITPDSSDIAQIYVLTQSTPLSGHDVRANADTVANQLHNGFNAAVSKASVLHADWKKATLNRVMVIEIEDQKLPSKKIVLEASDGKTTLRCSAKCMQIGKRWFIGEDLRYGV